MTDAAPPSEVFVVLDELPSNARQFQKAHAAVQTQYRRDENTGAALIRMAWLVLLAIEHIRQMEESHAEHDRPRRSRRRRRALPGVVRHVIGGGWRFASRTPA